jgi:outer membrane lipoprotein-sorting protein
LFFIFLISHVTSYAFVINSATVEFRRSLKQKNNEETIEGFLYYQFPNKNLAYIQKPIKQWMSFDSNTVVIYYPEDSIAFNFISAYPVSVSFFETFLNVMKEDFGVCDQGYALKSHQTKKDTLTTYWNPPYTLSKTIGGLKLVYVKNRIIYSELKKKSGELLLKASFKNHLKHGEYYFPREINATFFEDKDTILENITYTKLIFNDSLPEEIVEFKIPQWVEIEEIKW